MIPAGIMTSRDGYTENLATGNDIDGRDMYSMRGTLRFTPSDRTTIDLMVNYMEDDSSRSRYQKKLCNRDPIGNLGCLGDSLEFELPNGLATLPSNLASNLVLGDLTNPDPIANWGLSLFPFGYDIMGGTANPADMRVVNLDFEPTYYAEDTFISLTLDQAIGDLGPHASDLAAPSLRNVDVSALLDVTVHNGIYVFLWKLF